MQTYNVIKAKYIALGFNIHFRLHLRVAFVTDPQQVRMNGALRLLSFTKSISADFIS